MADNSKVIFGGGALAAIGVAVGMFFGGTDVSGIEDQVGAASSEVASINVQLSELGQRLEALEAAGSSMPDTPPLTAADLDAAITDATGEISDRIDSVETEFSEVTEALGEQIDDANAAQIEKAVAAMDARFDERMKEHHEQMKARHERGGERHGADGQQAEMGGNKPSQMPASEDMTREAAPDRVTTETIMLADDKIRAYVSGYIADEDIARVAINGFTVSDIRKGRSAEVEVGEETCSVTFNGIVDNHVQLDAVCE